jgi:hypothetical protein
MDSFFTFLVNLVWVPKIYSIVRHLDVVLLKKKIPVLEEFSRKLLILYVIPATRIQPILHQSGMAAITEIIHFGLILSFLYHLF